MSDALFATSQALKARIEAVTGVTVHVGGPPSDPPDDGIVLILFDVQPNAALRNVPRYASPAAGAPITGAAPRIEAIALDLRYVIFCYRDGGNAFGADPNELKQLGRIVATLSADPVLNVTLAAPPAVPPPIVPPPPVLEEQIVRVSLESYGLDEWNRFWALFPELSFRTSLAYLATPVYVEASEALLYPPVLSRKSTAGVLDPPVDRAA